MRDSGWRGKWVNGHRRWEGSLGIPDTASGPVETAKTIENERPKYLVLYDANGKPLGRDHRLGFVPPGKDRLP